MKPNNPFLISGYHTPEYFCDRETESNTMLVALGNERNITLIAPRRIGKTGLIKNVFYKLKNEHPDVVTIYMDIFATQSLSDFVKLFADSVLGKLDSTPQKAMSRVAKFVKSCRPSFTIDEFTGIPKVTIDLQPTEEQTTLKEIFDYLTSSDERCYIAIDEFQQIAEYSEKGVEALLRSYIQFATNVNFIFAGSKQHVMQEMFLSAKRPFYQSTQTLSIECIDADIYYEFAHNFFASKGVKFERSIFQSIYDEFDGHTWYVQSILNRLYGYQLDVTAEVVREAIIEIINESTYAYQNLLAAYSLANIKLLKAIAKEGRVVEINAGEFVAKHNLRAVSSVNTSLKKLIDKELVYKTSKGYILYDRFFSIWLREQPY